MAQPIDVDRQIITKDFGTDFAVIITISVAQLSNWLNGLCMLYFSVVPELIVTAKEYDGTKIRLRICDDERNDGLTERKSGKLERLNSLEMRVQVDADRLAYWIEFFLRYLRDGVAAVNHVDTELQDVTGHFASCDVVLKVESVVAPISKEELMKIFAKRKGHRKHC